jgi:glutathione S-transferase
MTIAPIVQTVRVKAPPQRAFDLFAGRMGDWWPKGRTPAKAPHVALVIEPHADGGWFERDADGNETKWGKVLAWEPPSRLLLAWQLNSDFDYDPTLSSEVELTFAPAESGGTLVRLEHRNLEQFGADAAKFADRLRGGWPVRINEYARFADATESATAPDITLHTIPGSPFGRSVLAFLEEKGAPYRLQPLRGPDIKAPEHLARHPFGRVPVLDFNGFVLYETQAILRFLEHLLPGPSFLPVDVYQRARMDQVMSICDWYLFQGVNNVIGFQRIVGPALMGLTPDEALIAAAMPKAHVVVRELSRLLGDDAYFAGAQISLADFHLAPQLDFLAMTPEWAELSAQALNLTPWLRRVTERPSFEATTWERVEAMAKAA